MRSNLIPAPLVLITGASDGIGRAMAISFAKRGFRLALLARRKPLLDEIALECLEYGAPKVLVRECDVTHSVRFRESLEAIERDLGQIDIFIANAGIGGAIRPDEDGYSELMNCFSVNVLGAIDGIEWMKTRMVARKKGLLVGVSSIAGIRGLPTSAAYCASKAAMTTYLESLRVDLKPHGVKVITVVPGFIETALARKNRGKLPFIMPVKQAAELIVEDILKEKRLSIVPRPFIWIGWFLKILPLPIYDLLISRSFRKRV